jgi:hypothetical protein
MSVNINEYPRKNLTSNVCQRALSTDTMINPVGFTFARGRTWQKALALSQTLLQGLEDNCIGLKYCEVIWAHDGVSQ